ncbi:Na+/H+ antiporter NhaC family protein [Fuerstiella marisgermanici]|uniref:Na+/H+ antiporter NhaC n=1 Tax=Fuerstiella marisgermanici TaxID=1891926 RepID=A0A1P8WBC4_9PLAN|nr:Na+/H+ antiporter NhaC family protein [Fuerstiella marisgermanici]APZ91355.1 Na+/H+ antiporter NhaC [Fuerstiella marisgermanici]
MPNDPGTIQTMIELYPWLRLAPPVAAITLAVAFKDVNFALLLAVLCGCLLLADFNLSATVDGLCDLFVNVVADADHASVILFTILLGAMIGLMNDSGGTDAVVNRIAAYANTRRKGQVLTWLAGVVVFFDDYANTMLIGGSVRPLTDRLKISRAKLAFLIDATAAPIAGLALSTWTAFEIDQVQLGITEAGMTAAAGEVFLATMPYRIYPIVAIIIVGTIAFSGRDFGPMLKAERRCLQADSHEQNKGDKVKTGSMWTAIIPVGVLIATVVGLLFRYYWLGTSESGTELSTGEGNAWWAEVDAYRLLLVTALSASTAAVICGISIGKMTLAEASESWANGITSMIPAIIVLVLAWAVNSVCSGDNLNTAAYIISLIGESVRGEFLPVIAFITAGAMAVAIGSSFTTMGLLIPLFIPLSNAVLGNGPDGLCANDPVFLATIGAILAGAIFGDHCSPISDTTVLSSAAAGCNHLDHVGTQLPYAMLIAACSLLFGYLPIGFGLPWWVALPLSTAMCIGAILVFGTEPTEEAETLESRLAAKSE